MTEHTVNTADTDKNLWCTPLSDTHIDSAEPDRSDQAHTVPTGTCPAAQPARRWLPEQQQPAVDRQVVEDDKPGL